MPYHSLGSLEQVSNSRRYGTKRGEGRGTDLGVAKVDESILVRGVSLLQVVHHQIAVALHEVSASISRPKTDFNTYRDYPKPRHCGRRF